ATVTEVGKMMGVDRCDIMVFSRGGELRVTHEYRADNGDGQSPSFLQTIPVDIHRLQDGFDIFTTHAIEDTSAEHLPEVIRTVAELVGAKSSLLVPMLFQYEPVGIIGLHHCRQGYHWIEEERNFVRSLAQQIAIGYRYTKIYTEKEQEARTNKALLEIANDINTGSDFTEVTAKILDRSVELLNLQAACLAIIDANGTEIHFANLRTAAGVPQEILKESTLKIQSQPMLPPTVERGKMLKMLSPDHDTISKYFLTRILQGGAALVVPILIEEKIFGGLILAWAEPRASFSEDDVMLAVGI